MHYFQINRRICLILLLTGAVLASVALFLHPMSPEDFLGLVFSDPLQSVIDAQGGNMAIFFWVSVALAVVGLSGWLTSFHLLRRFLHQPRPGLHALRR
jgi:hypothetical protein